MEARPELKPFLDMQIELDPLEPILGDARRYIFYLVPHKELYVKVADLCNPKIDV
jgi:hypothetical protein